MSRRRIELPPGLAASADGQHGALSTRQIVGAVGRGGLRSLVAGGVLVDGGQRGVYQVAGSRHTRRRELSALLLRAGRGAAAADETALALHGLPGFALGPPYRIAIPTDRRVTGIDATIRHLDLAEEEQTVVHDLASMTVARALVSISRHGVGRRERAAVDEALRRQRTDRARLRSTIEAHPSHPGAAHLRREFAGRTFDHDSEAERRLAALFRPGDPQPVWQVWVLPDVRSDGALLDARMTLEYHSRDWHLQAGDQDHDGTRRLRLAAAAIEEIVVTAGMLRDEPDRTRRRILAVYAQRVADGVEPITPHPAPPWFTGAA